MTNQNTTMPYPYPNPKPEEVAVFFLREHTLPGLEFYVSSLEAQAAAADGVNDALAHAIRCTAEGARHAIRLVESTLDCHAPVVTP